MMSESIGELAAALSKAQASMQAAEKNSTNPHFKSKYADLGAIWSACRKVLTDHGLSVVQMPTDSSEGRVALTTTLLHTSGEYIGSTCSTRLQQDSAQGVGSALTYLRRYALAAIVGIVADEDDDGNTASQPQQRPQEQTIQRPANGAPLASEPQKKKLFAVWKNGGYEGTLQDWIQNEYGCKVDALTMKDASTAIELLQPKETPGVVSKTAELPV